MRQPSHNVMLDSAAITTTCLSNMLLVSTDCRLSQFRLDFVSIRFLAAATGADCLNTVQDIRWTLIMFSTKPFSPREDLNDKRSNTWHTRTYHTHIDFNGTPKSDSCIVPCKSSASLLHDLMFDSQVGFRLARRAENVVAR